MRVSPTLVAKALVLVAVFLVAAPASSAADTPIEEIYASLRPQDLRSPTGSTAFAPGTEFVFAYDLVNISGNALVIPLNTAFGAPFHLVGTEQKWIERLGPNATIPGIPPIIGRKGTWYAAGGSITALENLPGNTIQPGQRLEMNGTLFPNYGTSFPAGRYRYHIEYKPLFGGLFDVIAEVSIELTVTGLDLEAPVLSVPETIVAVAETSAGVTVAYSVEASDGVDPAPDVGCLPPSGSVFPIGTMTVTCTATDAAGNTSSASFDVRVKGAAEQLADLAIAVSGVGSGASLADKVGDARTALVAGKRAKACEILGAFRNEVSAQSGKSLPAQAAAELRATATRIQTVLEC
ncbi:MAG TPA: HYR domain-containing protein [Gaiella sp.]